MTTHKKGNSLVYQPIDKWAATLLDEPSRIRPFVISFLTILIIIAGLFAYSNNYKRKAVQFFNQNDYQKVALDYSYSSLSYLARLKLGKEALDQKKYDEAISWYTPVSEKNSIEPILQVAALQNLAFAYMKKGDSEKALALLEKAANDPRNMTADYSKLLEGRVYEVKGDSQKAMEIYKQLSQGSNLSHVKEEASNRFAWLSQENK